jgi:hypothetical protein
MSIEDIARRVQRIYEIHSDVLAAEGTGRMEKAREKLIDGLGISCVLFRELLNDTALGSAKPNPEAWEDLRKLIQEERYQTFLKEETELLRHAGVSNAVSNEIVSEMDRILKQIAQERTIIKQDWPLRLEKLAGRVCDTAKQANFDRERSQLLGHAKKGAAGGLVVLINTSAPALFPPIAWVAHHSVAAGVSLIESAAGDTIGDAG